MDNIGPAMDQLQSAAGKIENELAKVAPPSGQSTQGSAADRAEAAELDALQQQAAEVINPSGSQLLIDE